MFEFNFDKSKQHLAVIGSPGSGKSVYVEKILKQQMDKGYVKKEDIHIFIPSSNTENFNDYKKHNDFKSVFNRLWNHYTNSKDSCIIIFDDFNDDKSIINMRHESDEILKLFNQGRKFNITAIIIGHHPSQSIGVQIKNSIYYFSYFPSNNNSIYKYISDNFLSGDIDNLKDKCKEVQKLSDHGLIIIDKRCNITIDENINEEDIISDSLSNIDIQDYELNRNDPMIGGSKNYGVSSNIQNYGQYNDNSSVNIQNKNIEYNNLVKQETNNHNIRLLQYKNKYSEDKESYKYEVRQLMSKVPHSLEDKKRMIYLLKNLVKKQNIDINLHNYIKYGKMFIKKYFNEELQYDHNKNNLLQYADVYCNGEDRDIINYGIQNAITYLNEDKIKTVSNVCKKSFNWLLMKD